MIKGNLRVTDIYLTEFNRLFIHFWPRYLVKLHGKDSEKLGFAKPLDEGGTWHKEYYQVTKFGYKRKKMFIDIKGAKQG